MLDLKSIPDEHLWALAMAAARNSDFEGSERGLREMARRHPKNIEVLNRLVDVLRAQGSRRDALAASRQLVGLSPRSWQAQLSLADSLSALGQLEAAGRAYEQALNLGADQPDFYACYGAILERLRKTDKARAMAHRALELNPAHGAAMNLLGDIEMVAGNEDKAEEWIQRSITDSQNMDARASAWHRLGALREKQKRWDEAFQAHDRANRVVLNLPAARHMLATPVFEHLPHQFLEGSEERLARWAARKFTDGPPDPVFMVGFPRSGTTMTENILGAIPGTITTDEEPVLSPAMKMAYEMCGSPPIEKLEEALDTLTHEQLVKVRAEYWKTVDEMVSPMASKAPLVVDKAPLRFIQMLYLNLLFPQGRMIFVVRDPRDCCLSCFFQDFARSPTLVKFLKLETTGEAYADVMTFWLRARTRATIPWMEVRYEDLVTDFEPHARKLVSFIGREWSDDILRFNEKASGRAVRTPSFRAITEKVNTRAIGKWSKYEAHIGPLIERVRPFIGVMGYEE